MVRPTRRILAFCVLGSALELGCAGGTETGNPPLAAKLSYTAYSTQPDVIAVRETGSELSVTSAWLVLGDVTFVPDGDCGGANAEEPHAPGLGVGNHAGLRPASTEFSLPEGQYCEVDLPFVAAQPSSIPSEAPEEMLGHSILVDGQLADGTAFRLVSKKVGAVRLSPPSGGFSMTAKMPSALMAFDTATWLSGVDFSSATPRSDGSVHIGAGENEAQLRAFEDALERGVTLFRDADGDGRVDSAPESLAQGR